jgi:hypothetical protein
MKVHTPDTNKGITFMSLLTKHHAKKAYGGVDV